MCGPIHFDERVCRNQFAVRAVHYIQEPVLVRLNHDFSKLASNPDIREQLFVGRIDVVHIVRGVLVITNDLTCFWPEREDAIREQTVEAFPRSGIVWFRVACSPIDEIEVGIV